MGSNLVPAKGGARRRRTIRKRGGDFMTAMSMRDFASSNPSGILQQASEAWMGQGPYKTNSADPSSGTVRLAAPGMAPISPQMISVISKDMTTLANPSPYPAVK